jgi:ATP-binding cassette subfamily B protein
LLYDRHGTKIERLRDRGRHDHDDQAPGTEMADYYSLIANAVAEKEPNETRLAIYERARAAMRELHKRGRLSSDDLNREGAALDRAIRDFEAETGSRNPDLLRIKAVLDELTKASAPGPASPQDKAAHGPPAQNEIGEPLGMPQHVGAPASTPAASRPEPQTDAPQPRSAYEAPVASSPRGPVAPEENAVVADHAVVSEGVVAPEHAHGGEHGLPEALAAEASTADPGLRSSPDDRVAVEDIQAQAPAPSDHHAPGTIGGHEALSCGPSDAGIERADAAEPDLHERRPDPMSRLDAAHSSPLKGEGAPAACTAEGASVASSQAPIASEAVMDPTNCEQVSANTASSAPTRAAEGRASSEIEGQGLGALLPAEPLRSTEPTINRRPENFVLLSNVPMTASVERPDPEADGSYAIHPRLKAMMQAARHHGIELDPDAFRPAEGEPTPSATALATWAQDAGLWSRAIRMHWRHLLRFQDTGPVVLLFNDGSAGLLSGADPVQKVVLLRDPDAPAGTASVPVDELRLSQVWTGEAVLLRAARGRLNADALFSFKWLAQVVLQEHRTLREIALASFTISFLTVFPPLLVMATVNKVLQFHSVSTLALISAILAAVVIYETLLGYARRLVIAVVGARLDAKLNLHVFNRLLRLPLDYFERHPAGETMYRIAQVYRVREFLTGRLLTTLLDLITLCVLLPILFYLNAPLAGIVLACAVVISLIVLVFLKPLRAMYAQVTAAETWKSAALGETIVGIKTIKALALEPQRRALWDERVAETGKSHLAFARAANWPQTLVTPIERFMVLGTLMLGAYMAMNDPAGYMVGALFAFMMLSARVAHPLVGLARLLEDYEEVNAAIGEAGSVLNRPLEVAASASGLRPKFFGAITFSDVSFTYPGTQLPALERVSFDIPANTMLGIVGRSGSGKSTVTRLLQGINREYQGFIKLDGADLRDIDLRHLRQSFGVVLQSNFLFRGSIRDNIIAGRPGLTLADAVSAARLAGAEEFIERMPSGYDTYVEEGSPNLSGGQAQRLAIARALIHDPRIVILDEATSALDPESEAVLSANLLRIARSRTMIIVSHRLSSLIECDRILVLDQGKVVDLAPHPELLERCAIYRQLWAQQHRHLDGRGPARQPIAAPRLVPGS